MKINSYIGIFGIILLVLTISIFSFSSVSAYSWVCFEKGQKIDFCNPKAPDRICDVNSGYCSYCLGTYDSAKKCYKTWSWNGCNDDPPKCEPGEGDGGSVDTTAPNISISKPENNSLWTAQGVPLTLSTNEFSDIYFLDVLDGRGRWSRLCENCKMYSKPKNFKEGINMIRIRATDKRGNEGFKDVTFFIDSKKPRIHKTEPKKGFANGIFSVQYTEDNVKKINITYGNGIKGFKSVNLNNCPSGKKVNCQTSKINLSEYSGQEIQYFFTVEDKAGSRISSKIVRVKVDITPPKVDYFNYTLNNNKLSVVFNITEPNFDKIDFIDSGDSRPRFRTLCSSLKEGKVCDKKISLKEGVHNIVFIITDDAGNSANRTINNLNAV